MTKSANQNPCCPSGNIELRPIAPQRQHAAHVFRALADATRLEVFALIAARPEPVCVCDIVPRFEVSQSTISHHLKILREARLVTATRRGTWSYYEVDRHGAEAARRALVAVLPEPAAPMT